MLKRSALALAILAIAAVPALADGPFDFGHGDWGFRPEPGVLLIGTLAVVLVLTLTWLVLRRTRQPLEMVMPSAPVAAPFTSTQPSAGGSPPVAPASAFAILAERFARGEIDRKEYEDRRAGLAGEPVTETPPAPPAA